MDSIKINNIMSLLSDKVDVVSFGLIKDKLEKIDDNKNEKENFENESYYIW